MNFLNIQALCFLGGEASDASKVPLVSVRRTSKSNLKSAAAILFIDSFPFQMIFKSIFNNDFDFSIDERSSSEWLPKYDQECRRTPILDKSGEQRKYPRMGDKL